MNTKGMKNCNFRGKSYNKMLTVVLFSKKVQVGKDQEKAQSEKDSHSKNRGGEKAKLTIRYLYHENISKAE